MIFLVECWVSVQRRRSLGGLQFRVTRELAWCPILEQCRWCSMVGLIPAVAVGVVARSCCRGLLAKL
ncbi:hypothetical protein V6N12_030842 [Hibiscus sabdariffa]|uniref:Uncharacterized protein n=1 Tax=Hibiscus sabdariffa TaxID=183260 RepID=A0ABR2EAQ6_9ROSI